MAKSKKKKEEEDFTSEEMDSTWEEDLNENKDSDPFGDEYNDLNLNPMGMNGMGGFNSFGRRDPFGRNSMFFDDMPMNPMGLAHQINKESETVKHFKDMPKETRNAFLDKEDKSEIKHHARAYRTWHYIEKILELRVEEDKLRKEVISKIQNIKTKEQLKEYLKFMKRDYMLNNVDDLSDEDVALLVKHVLLLKPNNMLETIEKKKAEISLLYTEYNINSKTPEYVDDMDNLGKVVDTTILSMGYKGNAAQHSVMTIQAIKNEDVMRDVEKKSTWSLLDSIKRKFS